VAALAPIADNSAAYRFLEWEMKTRGPCPWGSICGRGFLPIGILFGSIATVGTVTISNGKFKSRRPNNKLRRAKGGLVRTYRIYSVDSRGRIVGDREIEAENDEEDIFAARSLQRTLVTEVWSRDRRIGRVPPFTPAEKAPIRLAGGK